jgi:hypothetical protein
MKRIFFVLLLFLMAHASLSYAQTIKQITNNSADDDNPQINDNGYIVWSGSDGADYEIFLYDGLNTTQITDNARGDHQPQINDNGHVVWDGSDGADPEIFLYDGLNTTQITNNAYQDNDPSINDNGYVVWDGSDGADPEIFLYDGLKTNQLTDNAFVDELPQINNNGYVVWHGFDGADYEIFLYDGLNTTNITQNASDDFIPQSNDNNHVVWVGFDGADWEIYLYDGLNTTKLTNNAFDDLDPQINNDGYVVWSGRPDGSDSEIFLYDGLTITQLTNNAFDDLDPQINNSGYIVWSGSDGSDNEVFLTSAFSSVTLLSPTAEEILPSGSLHTIRWSGPLDAVKFKLKYSMDNGLTWKPLPSTRDFIQNTHYDWEVPKPVKNKKNCLIKVIGYKEDGAKVGVAKSSAPFTIEVLTITAPAISEIVPQNAPYTITWTAHGTAATPDQVIVKYTLNNGKTWKTAQGTPDLGSSSFSWDVPTVAREKNKAKVKVILKASGVTVAKAVSGIFTVQ